MKTIMLILIKTYQTILSPLLHQLLGQKSFCRYSPTCSTFAKDAIITHGAFRGGMMALHRLFHCQPFIKSYASL